MTEAQAKMEVRGVKLRVKNKRDDEPDEEKRAFVPEIVLHDPILKCTRPYQDCENLCHPDFVKAVLRLNGHLAVLTDIISEDDFERSETVTKYVKARGYSLAGAFDELRITLKGHRKTVRGGAVILNAPATHLNEDGENPYNLLSDLLAKIKVIESEALRYCFEGRQYVDPQQSLFPDPDEAVTKLQIAPHVDADPSMNSPEGVVAAIVKETNLGKEIEKTAKKRGRTAQTASNPSGIVKD
jgi:hypothetical protein